jgi:hypothetical protein
MPGPPPSWLDRQKLTTDGPAFGLIPGHRAPDEEHGGIRLPYQAEVDEVPGLLELALSLLRVEKAILGSVQTSEEAFEIVRNLSAWTAENGHPSSHSRSAKRPSAKSKSGR